MQAIEIIAHRGAGEGLVQSGTPPENTLPAFAYAWSPEVNADAAEADVHLTKDGELVVIHDATTDRTTNASWVVAEHTMAELRSLDAGTWKAPRFAGVRLPALEEVIETIPEGKRLFTEIKAGPQIAGRLESVVRGSGKTPAQLPLISFHIESIRRAKDRMPEHECYLLVSFEDGAPPAAGPSELDALIEQVEQAGLDGIDVSLSHPAGLRTRMREHGLKAVVWTVNDVERAKQMIQSGIRSITTDMPGFMRRQLVGKAPVIAALGLLVFAAVLGAQTRGGATRQFELKAESPRFWELIAEDARLEKVAGGFGFLEGPVWDPHGFLYVSDEEQNKLSRVYPDGRVEAVLSIGDPDGSTLDARGRLVTTASVLRAIIQVDPDGKYKVLADRYQGKRFNSPNDIVAGPDASLYFTDPTLDLPKGDKQEIPFQGVYRLGNDGSVRLLTSEMAQPNGLAFSPDGKRLYIDDTKQREIRVYDVAANGDLKNGRVFGKEEGRGGVPDGMRVDVKGNVYCTGPGGIWVWDTEGNHLGTILLPESAANFNWGEPDYQTMYIAARTSVYRMKLKVRGFVPGAK